MNSDVSMTLRNTMVLLTWCALVYEQAFSVYSPSEANWASTAVYKNPLLYSNPVYHIGL